jgi:hypothetical protein
LDDQTSRAIVATQRRHPISRASASLLQAFVAAAHRQNIAQRWRTAPHLSKAKARRDAKLRTHKLRKQPCVDLFTAPEL